MKKGKIEQFAGEISRLAKRDANSAATVNSMTLSMWVLHKEFGFGSERIKRFYRENKEYSREQGGTGLGLAICKEAAEKMGGTIRYRSTEGEGSTFLVWIPVHNK